MWRALNRRALRVVALLTLHAGMLAWSASRHSPATDEIAHLPAGVSIWHFGRFELYCVNPPLVKALAAVPVVAAGPVTDWSSFNDRPGVRSEWNVGYAFIRANREQWPFYFMVARWAVIPLSVIGAFVCYRWAGELYGEGGGLVALSLWCFSPSVLGHAALITPDAPAAALGLTAAYFFWRWLRGPDFASALVAGVAMGLAQLTKMTWILLFPLWPVLWFAWVWGERRGLSRRDWGRRGGQLLLIVLLGLYVLNLGYAFDGSLTPLGDYRFVSRSLGGVDKSEDEFFPWGNRFSGTWAGTIPVPLPEPYLIGLDLQKKDFETVAWSYLGGEYRQGGWWYYYLYALGVKEPLGTWLLLLLALVASLAWRGRLIGLRNELVLLAPAVLVFAVVSSQTNWSRHFRYVLPALPFLFVWAARVADPLVRQRTSVRLLTALALGWSIVSSLLVYPHSLSYFNEAVGGPTRGHEHLLESSLDWGQDLFYLKEFLEQRPELTPVYTAYVQTIRPDLLGIPYRPPPPDPRSEHVTPSYPREELGPLPGWYAVSAQRLREPGGLFGYLLDRKPVARCGYSIHIYHITPEECDRLRAELALPPVGRAK